MVYGLDDDIDKTLSLATTLTRIIAHYSECDNPEGGMWDVSTLPTIISAKRPDSGADLLPLVAWLL
jgi:hypothetical protein